MSAYTPGTGRGPQAVRSSAPRPIRPGRGGCALALIGSLLIAPPAVGDYADHPAAQAFRTTMIEEHDFAPGELDRLLATAQRQDSIIEAMNRPAEALPWRRYRPIFVTDDRAAAGVEFWREHAGRLAAVENEFGVPAALIVAILGVETRYGDYTGRHRVLDALATLAFDYPQRADFFREELRHFLLLTRELEIPPEQPKGSYAGAMGWPQFIASSYRAYATDGDGDGRRDLWDSPEDILASIANYFRAHGWQSGDPIVRRARLTAEAQPEAVMTDGLEPSHTLEFFGHFGIEPTRPINPGRRAKLLELEGSEGTEYWLGFRNFYVISRYNHSALYSLAVYQLAQAIRTARAETERGAG